MRIVFDLDDTVSVHKNRDFKNAVPITETIEKIRALKAQGAEIVIYTARGQNSCKGDLKLIEERNRAQIEKWLEEHDVPYDSLVFGKPLGDVYVDDKGVSLDDFLEEKYERMYGYSGAEVYRAGKRVIKRCDNAQAQAEWYREARSLGLNTPYVHSAVLNTIDTDFIDGESGADEMLSERALYDLVDITLRMSLKKTGSKFSVQALKGRVRAHLKEAGSKTTFDRLFRYLDLSQGRLEKTASFCHGDLSLSNTIFVNEKIYLIDPIPGTEYSSYLMDLAKLRFSMDGGESFLHGGLYEYGEALQTFDSILQENKLYELVEALEATYWLRLLKYTPEKEKREHAIAQAKYLETCVVE